MTMPKMGLRKGTKLRRGTAIDGLRELTNEQKDIARAAQEFAEKEFVERADGRTKITNHGSFE
jgi:hypothetical protein